MTDHYPAMAPVIVAALVRVANVFSDLTTWLRNTPGFSSVTQSCWMSSQQRRDEYSYEVGRGSGLLIEWYADAEYESGAALGFGMSLIFDEDEWTIESSVRVVDQQGQDMLIELATRHAVDDDDLVQELASAASALGATRERAVLEFEKRYGTTTA